MNFSVPLCEIRVCVYLFKMNSYYHWAGAGSVGRRWSLDFVQRVDQKTGLSLTGATAATVDRIRRRDRFHPGFPARCPWSLRAMPVMRRRRRRCRTSDGVHRCRLHPHHAPGDPVPVFVGCRTPAVPDLVERVRVQLGRGLLSRRSRKTRTHRNPCIGRRHVHSLAAVKRTRPAAACHRHRLPYSRHQRSGPPAG